MRDFTWKLLENPIFSFLSLLALLVIGLIASLHLVVNGRVPLEPYANGQQVSYMADALSYKEKCASLTRNE